MYTASGSLRLHLKSHLSRLAANAFNTINSFPQGPLPQRWILFIFFIYFLFFRDPLQPDCLAIKLEVDEDGPKRGTFGGVGGVLGLGGVSGESRGERGTNITKDGGGRERGESEEGEGGEQMSQVRNEEQNRKAFGHNQRESIEERVDRQGDFSRPSGFLAMPSAPSAQVPL